MTLLEQRIDFTKRFYNWQHWFYSVFQPAHTDCEIAFDEAKITPHRLVWLDGKKVKLPDAEHGDLSRGFTSRHHDGCAADVNLYVYNSTKNKFVYISDGSHPYWIEIARKAEDFGLTNGASFNDINHFSTKSPDGRK